MEFASYLAAAGALAPSDLIFVAARARAACLQKALGLLAPGGVVVLHDANRDANRDAYLGATSRYPKQLLFRDHRQVRKAVAGGVWVGGKECDPASLVRVGLHRRLWAFYSEIGRPLS